MYTGTGDRGLITDSPKSPSIINQTRVVPLGARHPLTEIISAPPRTGCEPNQGHPLVLACDGASRGSRVDKKSSEVNYVDAADRSTPLCSPNSLLTDP